MTEKPQGIELKPRIIELLQKRFDYIFRYDGSPEILMKYLYKTADIIYREQIKPAAVCPSSGGCDHCCRVPVQVTALEVDYIQKMTGREAVNLLNISFLVADNSPCPFLKKSMCSIYEFRPLNCRVFASMDSVEHCKTRRCKTLDFNGRKHPRAIGVIKHTFKHLKKHKIRNICRHSSLVPN